jgi:hypothetical protein
MANIVDIVVVPTAPATDVKVKNAIESIISLIRDKHLS